MLGRGKQQSLPITGSQGCQEWEGREVFFFKSWESKCQGWVLPYLEICCATSTGQKCVAHCY